MKFSKDESDVMYTILGICQEDPKHIGIDEGSEEFIMLMSIYRRLDKRDDPKLTKRQKEFLMNLLIEFCESIETEREVYSHWTDEEIGNIKLVIEKIRGVF